MYVLFRLFPGGGEWDELEALQLFELFCHSLPPHLFHSCHASVGHFIDWKNQCGDYSQPTSRVTGIFEI